MKTQYQKLYEAGKKAGKLHISCLAGSLCLPGKSLNLKGKCPTQPFKSYAPTGLKLSSKDKKLFTEINKVILGFCHSADEKGKLYCEECTLDEACHLVQRLIAESEQFGEHGAAFFKAGILMKVLEVLSGKDTECRIQGLLIEKLAPSSNSPSNPNLWIFPGEEEFIKGGFDIGKLRLNGPIWDIIRNGCRTDSELCGLFDADLPQTENAITAFARELSIKYRPTLPPVIHPKTVCFHISNTKEHTDTWRLTVSHNPSKPANSLQKASSSFQAFTVTGRKKIEQLILAITKEERPRIDDSQSKTSLYATFGQINANRSNLNKAFKEFHGGLRTGATIKIDGDSSYCRQWLADSVDEILVDIV